MDNYHYTDCSTCQYGVTEVDERDAYFASTCSRRGFPMNIACYEEADIIVKRKIENKEW
jgi:hypothetical protein